MKNAVGICHASGFVFPLAELVRQYDGAMVHPRYLDHRHPQDMIKVKPESHLPYTSPEPADVFVGTNEVQPGDL